MRGLRAWGVVSQNVMCDPEISVSAKGLYALLCAHADKDGRCFPSNETLAHELGVEERTIQRLLRELVGADVVVREERFELGRQITSITRVIDGSTSPRGDVKVAPGGDTYVTQNKTTSNKKNPSGSSATRKQASSPWPSGWDQPPDNLIAWTRKNHPRLNINAEWSKFHDYALAHDKRYVDWNAAWRTWARNVQNFAPPRQRVSPLDQINYPR